MRMRLRDLQQAGHMQHQWFTLTNERVPVKKPGKALVKLQLVGLQTLQVSVDQVKGIQPLFREEKELVDCLVAASWCGWPEVCMYVYVCICTCMCMCMCIHICICIKLGSAELSSG